MSDREILLRWLATAAARLRWSRQMRELGWLACALVALGLLPVVLQIFGTPDPVLSALTPLLVIAALAAAALAAWRLARPTTLAHAAGAADTRAGLKDQLRSAHWFAQRGVRDAFVELLLARASQTVERLDARRLFPMAAPRSVLTALALAAFTGFLAWFSPHFALPVTPDALAGTPASGNARDAVSGNEREKTIAEVRPQDAAARHDLSADWAQLEQLAKELPAGAERETVKRAVAARDARLAVQLLQASERNRAAAVPKARADPQREMKTAAAAQRLLDALKELSNQENKTPSEPPIKSEVSPTVRTATRLREQAREERRKITGTPTQGQVTLNNRLRAVSRVGAGMREVPYGQGEAAAAGSQTSVSGAATGERTGKSQAGGSEGEHPNSSPTGDGDDQPVLGERTERLAAQLEKMSLERSEDSKRQEAVEEFYAATQRQASEVEYESIAAQWRPQREAVVAPGATPLSYREAVKQYFLSQHAKED